MKVVFLNIKKEDDLRDRVREVMIRQIKKKFLLASGNQDSIKSCDAPFKKSNSFEQIQNQTV